MSNLVEQGKEGLNAVDLLPLAHSSLFDVGVSSRPVGLALISITNVHSVLGDDFILNIYVLSHYATSKLNILRSA
jgi:hypothetical protein